MPDTPTPVFDVEPATKRVLADIAQERMDQDQLWGEQNHHNGTGGHRARQQADMTKATCQRHADHGALTWRDVLREEVREAFAESDPVALRAELVQVAAVAAAWIEAIDRNEATR